MAEKNPLIELESFGQSIWLDYISRELLKSGELGRLIKEDHLKGLTSNPSIFEKAIAKTNDYDDLIKSAGQRKLSDAKAVYENIAIKDIQSAADLLRPVYEKSQGHDGYVSLEVSPHFAYDSEESIEEGKRLWDEVHRPNLMIKVPGTPQGMIAIRKLTSLGINVNVTLLFSINAYKDAALAYLAGLNDRSAQGLSLHEVHSVASFFVSRIDNMVDGLLAKIIEKNADKAHVKLAQALQGTIAIANAKMAYLLFEEIYRGDLAKSLMQKGANPQRLLWASTSTKNKNYSDVLYVDSLIGDQTVITLPPATLVAFRDHGHASLSIKNDIDKASLKVAELKSLGIDFNACCDELLQDGVVLFSNDFDQMMSAINNKLSLLAEKS